MKYTCTVNGNEYSIEILDERRVSINGRELIVDFTHVNSQPVYSLLVDGRSYDALVVSGEAGWEVQLKGRHYNVAVVDERSKRLNVAGAAGIETGDLIFKAPMPGLVVAVSVEPGQEVQKGQVLLILESMKMQNELKAPRGGRVGRVHVQPGETVEQRQALLSITA